MERYRNWKITKPSTKSKYRAVDQYGKFQFYVRPVFLNDDDTYIQGFFYIYIGETPCYIYTR